MLQRDIIQLYEDLIFIEVFSNNIAELYWPKFNEYCSQVLTEEYFCIGKEAGLLIIICDDF